MRGLSIRSIALTSVIWAVLWTGGCEVFERDVPAPPTAAEARAYYGESYPGLRDVRVRGNVVVLRARQPSEQLRRGGSLWARVGPYVYLFSPATRELLASEPGVAAVRAITFTEEGEEVARAMLDADTLSVYQWEHAIRLLGHALQRGTQQPARLEDLVFWAERYTEHHYSEQFVGG